MNIFLRFTSIAVASVAVLFAAGCSKKPQRPNPGMTIGIGGAELQPVGIEGSGLETRDPLGNVDRTIFAANTVYFDYDSAAVKQAERAKVQQVADYLKSNPGSRILLEGHCDWRGTTEYNMGLGDRRANAVKSYLGTLGIDASRIETVSKGDLDAKEGASDAEMKMDRRVDVGLIR
ncbi:MAG: OmpA family protein [Opitutaceae bacterium]|nr:OmpA family protein [Opitutaceae bacterium]